MESRGTDHIQAVEAREKPTEIPKLKSQAPKKFHSANSKASDASVRLNIEIWCFPGVWASGLGASVDGGFSVENDGRR
jgi:hypothetical protein